MGQLDQRPGLLPLKRRTRDDNGDDYTLTIGLTRQPNETNVLGKHMTIDHTMLNM